MIGNRDRHDHNWHVIRRATETRLAPSFDHATSLGFQLQDRRRAALLQRDPRLEVYSRRATAWRFAPGRTTQTDLVSLAARACLETDATAAWTERLDRRLHQAWFDQLLGQVSPMSVLSRRMVTALIMTNMRRLRHAWDS